jgi:hypothetical protein
VISEELLILFFRFVNRLHRSWLFVEVNLLSFLHPKISRTDFHIRPFVSE